MKYYIRTSGERILDESYNQITYIKLIDKEHRYIDFFVDELERVGDEDCVILEDDCVLCKDFKNRIEAVISQYPNKIINFFYWGQHYFKTRESDDYVQNQCTYYPKGLSKKLAVEMRKVHKKYPTLATDRVENIALLNLKETHIQYRPCLVQHLNFDSLLNHSIEHQGLRTPFFVDYLDKLNIDYNNISDIEMRRLQRELKYHILTKRNEWLKQKEDKSND